VQLAALVQFHRYCAANDLEYFILYGTLIGAVRHQGFIPWDDDIDIGMKRDHFERFVASGPGALGGLYFVQTSLSDAGYPLGYAKVRVKGTSFEERGFGAGSTQNGIFIDVFPLDAAPDSHLERWLHSALVRVLRTAALSRSDYHHLPGAARSIVYSTVRLLSCPFSTRQIAVGLRRGTMMFSTRDTQSLVSLGGPYSYGREAFPRAWLHGSTMVNFEGLRVNAPGHWHKYLTHLYGNYMELPPEEERVPRHHT
jgi:lipopolysaccharide cholinephosphotransferase